MKQPGRRARDPAQELGRSVLDPGIPQALGGYAPTRLRLFLPAPCRRAGPVARPPRLRRHPAAPLPAEARGRRAPGTGVSRAPGPVPTRALPEADPSGTGPPRGTRLTGARNRATPRPTTGTAPHPTRGSSDMTCDLQSYLPTWSTWMRPQPAAPAPWGRQERAFSNGPAEPPAFPREPRTPGDSRSCRSRPACLRAGARAGSPSRLRSSTGPPRSGLQGLRTTALPRPRSARPGSPAGKAAFAPAGSGTRPQWCQAGGANHSGR